MADDTLLFKDYYNSYIRDCHIDNFFKNQGRRSIFDGEVPGQPWIYTNGKGREDGPSGQLYYCNIIYVFSLTS